jgi:hypothetical protein
MNPTLTRMKCSVKTTTQLRRMADKAVREKEEAAKEAARIKLMAAVHEITNSIDLSAREGKYCCHLRIPEFAVEKTAEVVKDLNHKINGQDLMVWWGDRECSSTSCNY